MGGSNEPVPGGLGHAGSGDGLLVRQLQAIAAEIWSVAAARASAKAGPGQAAASAPAGGAGEDGLDRDWLIAAAEQEYRSRRAREALFNRDLFGEPAWDLLLYLFAAQLRGDLVLTSSLVRAAAVPPTTALRWIAQLERADLIERCTVKRDGRLRVQRLTRPAFARIEEYFRTRGNPAGAGPAQGTAVRLRSRRPARATGPTEPNRRSAAARPTPIDA